MEIYTLALSRLRNLAHFEFHDEVQQLVNKHTAEKLNIVAAFAEFCTLLDQEKSGLEVIRQHKLTAEIAQLDEQRDHIFSGLVTNVKSLKHHFNADIQAAAVELSTVLNTYGNLTTTTYNEETAGLHKLTEELLADYNNQLTTCNLVDWVTHLQTVNENFKTLMLSRNEDLTDQEPIHMRSVRKEIDRVYQLMVKRIEASALLNGEDDFKDFVNELNGRIEYYKEHNIHTKKKEDEEEEENENKEIQEEENK